MPSLARGEPYARWPLRHSALFTLDPSAPCGFCRCQLPRTLAPAPRGHLDPRAFEEAEPLCREARDTPDTSLTPPGHLPDTSLTLP